MQRVSIPDAEIPKTDPETLVYCFSPWVQWVANRYQNMIEATSASVDTNDLFQVGCIALLKAQKTYDPSRGMRFASYSFNYLRTAMVAEIRKNAPPAFLRSCISLDEPISENDTDSFSEIIADTTLEPMDEHMERQELQKEVHEAVDRLTSEKKKELIIRIYFKGQKLSDAAQEMGVSIGAASEAHNDALMKLRKDYALMLFYHPYFSGSLDRFRSRWESTVEAEVLWREATVNRLLGNGAYLGRLNHEPE